MVIVHVHFTAKQETVEAFRRAAIANARSSIQEPGVARFDVVQQIDDPARFVLVEHYYSEADRARHRETAHYAEWRSAIADLQAEPQVIVQYAAVYPGDEGLG